MRAAGGSATESWGCHTAAVHRRGTYSSGSAVVPVPGAFIIHTVAPVPPLPRQPCDFAWALVVGCPTYPSTCVFPVNMSQIATLPACAQTSAQLAKWPLER